jgi:hypothetical protein
MKRYISLEIFGFRVICFKCCSKRGIFRVSLWLPYRPEVVFTGGDDPIWRRFARYPSVLVSRLLWSMLH